MVGRGGEGVLGGGRESYGSYRFSRFRGKWVLVEGRGKIGWIANVCFYLDTSWVEFEILVLWVRK